MEFICLLHAANPGGVLQRDLVHDFSNAAGSEKKLKQLKYTKKNIEEQVHMETYRHTRKLHTETLHY